MEQESLRALHNHSLCRHTQQSLPPVQASPAACHTPKGVAASCCGSQKKWSCKRSCPPRLTHPTAALAQATAVPTMCMAAAPAALLVHSTDIPQLLKTRATPKGRIQLAHPTGPNIRCQPHLVLRHGSHSSTEPNHSAENHGCLAPPRCWHVLVRGPAARCSPHTPWEVLRWWGACLPPVGQPCR